MPTAVGASASASAGASADVRMGNGACTDVAAVCAGSGDVTDDCLEIGSAEGDVDVDNEEKTEPRLASADGDAPEEDLLASDFAPALELVLVLELKTSRKDISRAVVHDAEFSSVE